LSIRTLLVDDYASIRKSLRILLKTVPGVEVVGEAEDGRIAMELMHKLLPDIIIMDIRMPVMDGIEATRWITSVFPGAKVIAFTSCAEKSTIREMFEAGASGILLKGCGSVEIISAIKAVAEGKSCA
jgi:DNA-binding NarL/FixJ family response regulator